MGADGGTIPTRCELVTVKKKPEQVSRLISYFFPSKVFCKRINVKYQTELDSQVFFPLYISCSNCHFNCYVLSRFAKLPVTSEKSVLLRFQIKY